MSSARVTPAAEGLPADHPLRSAAWIWPEPYMYLHNHLAQFRHDFELAGAPDPAPLYITADKAYRLYVNGRNVCRGPARGYQSHWPFDEVDLSGYLTDGHNWIAVEGYNPGISTFQYVHQTWAGLLVAAGWRASGLRSGPGWLMRRSPAHATRTARLSMQLDFQEHVQVPAEGRDWIQSQDPPAAGHAGWERSGDGIPFGRPPWDTVEPRGTPLLREEVIAPAGVVCHATGTCAEGYQGWENVSWGWVAEARRISAWDSGRDVQARTREGWCEVEVEPTGAGRFRAITVDAGEYLAGSLIVETAGTAGSEVLDFQHSEGLVGGRPSMREPGSACLIALANRLRPGPGRTAHEFFHILGFRYVTLVARDVTRPITVRLAVRTARYPFAMRGRFECSDHVLNDIHAACRRTQQICALDAYVDTPWREQGQWWGDARVQAHNTFYLDGDPRLLVRGIRSIAGQAGPGGLTYGHAPTCAHNCILPDFSLTWVLTLWDHYWQTGETGLIVEQWPRVEQVLGYFDSAQARGRHGLLRHDRRFWYFGDWADLFRGEVPTLLNLWYLLALRRLADLLSAAGMEPAEEVRAEAAGHEERVLAHLYDPAQGLFRDGLDEAGEGAATASVHEQTVALMLGLAPEAHETMVRERLLPYLRGEDPPGAVPSAFWCTHVLEEMARCGYGEAVVGFIRRRWAPMRATGTTWEGFDWGEESGSASHAWSAHPCFHLVNVLAGITQEAAAWRRIRFAPCPAEGVSSASALVPAPPGDIAAAWRADGRRIEATLTLPEGVAAEVELPGVREELRGPGEFGLEADLG
jgi:alpha-L-rhamnosidase